MGKWMEALNEQGEVVIETVPYFLIYCSKHLPKQIKNEFPTLLSLDSKSTKWIDELQILSVNSSVTLNHELSRVRRILNFEEFIPKVDSKKILSYWTTDEYTLDDINEEIDFFMSFLHKAITLELEIRIYL